MDQHDWINRPGIHFRVLQDLLFIPQIKDFENVHQIITIF